MNMPSRTNVKPQHSRRSTVGNRSRKPVLETLEGRTLLSSSQGALHTELESRSPGIPSVALVQNANLYFRIFSCIDNGISPIAALAIEVVARGVEPCLRHAVS